MWTAPSSQGVLQCSDQIACAHRSGLFARSHMNAGRDGFRHESSKQYRFGRRHGTVADETLCRGTQKIRRSPSWDRESGECRFVRREEAGSVRNRIAPKCALRLRNASKNVHSGQQDKKGCYLTCFPGDCNDPTSTGKASITWIPSAGKSWSSWVMSAKVGLADLHSLKGGA
jgi:hypothetical protein